MKSLRTNDIQSGAGALTGIADNKRNRAVPSVPEDIALF